MQLIEVSEIGVRASIVRMTSRTSALEWLIFPMIHLGPSAYYAEVERRMLGCDLVLAEGVDSEIVQAITMSYRAAGGSERLNTVVQPKFHSGSSGPEVVNADISAAEFDQSWNQLPLQLRIGIPLLAPLYGVWLRYIANPEEFHKTLETYDLPSREQVEAEDFFPDYFDLLLHRRDTHLLEQIDEAQHLHGSDDLTFGVAYGAHHMPAVVNHMTDQLGYIASSAEWVTVFDYTK